MRTPRPPGCTAPTVARGWNSSWIPGGGSFQEYVEDCEVCCRPWRVEVTYDEDGRPAVELFTDDE